MRLTIRFTYPFPVSLPLLIGTQPAGGRFLEGLKRVGVLHKVDYLVLITLSKIFTASSICFFSTMSGETFVFNGFLPQKKGRQTKLKELAEETRTMIFYESPFRLVKALEEFAQYLGNERRASVSREISKMFEETKRGTIQELIEYFSQKTVKGEIVIVVEGKK